MPITLEDLRTKYRDDILKIAEKYGVTNIRVFGSVARGDAREDSDVDLLVGHKLKIKVSEILGFKREVERIVGRDVEICFEKAVKPHQWKYIQSDLRAL